MRYFIILMFALLPSFAGAASDGISRLNTVTTERSNNANDDAQDGSTPALQAQGLGARAPEAKVKLKSAPLTTNMNEAKLRDLEASMKALKQRMDSLSGLGEEQQLKLQLMQDHMTKMMALLSNMLKKASDTQSGIIQNMK